MSIAQIDDEFFNEFSISSDEEKFNIDFPRKEPQNNPFAFELHEMSPGDTLNIGSGTLEFPIVGVAYRDGNQSQETSIGYQFYDTQLRLMSRERVIELQYKEILQSIPGFRTTSFPSVVFIFRHEGIEDVMFHGLKCFDGRTHKRLQLPNGYGQDGNQACVRFDANISLWHKQPVDIVLDVSYGPSEIYEFPPVAGQGFKTGEYECRLLDVFENVSISVATPNTIFKFLRSSNDKLGQRFYFICQPQATYMPVTFELIDTEGNQLDIAGGRTSTYTHLFGLKEPLKEVTLVRANYRTKRYRIVFHLPNIPGLLEQNKDIDNLFDVYIPYASFNSSVDIQRFLQSTLQLNKYHRSGVPSANSVENINFPIDFNDTKIREIARVFSKSGSIETDIKNDEMILKYPIPLGTRLKMFFNKVFQIK